MRPRKYTYQITVCRDGSVILRMFGRDTFAERNIPNLQILGDPMFAIERELDFMELELG